MTGIGPPELAMIATTGGPRPRQFGASGPGPIPAKPRLNAAASTGRPMRQDFGPMVPNVARGSNCLLGGKENFTPDRQGAAALPAAVPGAAVTARETGRSIPAPCGSCARTPAAGPAPFYAGIDLRTSGGRPR